MPSNPEVEAWFTQLDNPLKPVMQRVREVLVGADPRIAEIVLYGTLQFTYKSPLCSFVQWKNTARVNLMFNAAGRLKGEFPHLEGKSVKYMYFLTPGDVDARAEELTRIAAAWIAYKDGASK